MRVVIADDHRIVREGLRMILSHDADVEVVAEVAGGEELLEYLKANDVDVVLLDLRMPDLSGLEVLEKLRDFESPPRVIALTMYDDMAYVKQAIERGAVGYLLKSVSGAELLRAVHTVAAGKSYIQGEITGPLVEHMVDPAAARPIADVGVEDIEILEMLASGLDNAQLAAALSVSPAAVKAKLRRIYKVLGVKRRSEAVAVALRVGLIS